MSYKMEKFITKNSLRLLSIVLFVWNLSCKSQNINAMETFDKAILKGQKKVIIKQNIDSIQEFGESENAFYQIDYKDKSPYKSIKTFSKKDGKIRSVTNKFYNILIGEYKRYDDKGNLNKDMIINYDVTFKLSDLVEKMKNNFAVDLLDSNRKDVSFHNENINQYYRVLLAKTYPTFREIKISAKDGSIISDQVIGYEK